MQGNALRVAHRSVASRGDEIALPPPPGPRRPSSPPAPHRRSMDRTQRPVVSVLPRESVAVPVSGGVKSPPSPRAPARQPRSVQPRAGAAAVLPGVRVFRPGHVFAAASLTPEQRIVVQCACALAGSAAPPRVESLLDADPELLVPLAWWH